MTADKQNKPLFRVSTNITVRSFSSRDEALYLTQLTDLDCAGPEDQIKPQKVRHAQLTTQAKEDSFNSLSFFIIQKQKVVLVSLFTVQRKVSHEGTRSLYGIPEKLKNGAHVQNKDVLLAPTHTFDLHWFCTINRIEKRIIPKFNFNKPCKVLTVPEYAQIHPVSWQLTG